MELAFEHNSFVRILYTLMAVAGALGPSIADFNRTHATNPLWTPHARFHVVWQVLTFWSAAAVALVLLWTPSQEYVFRLYLVAAMLFGTAIAFYATYFSMPLFGGKAYDTNGYLPWWTFRAFGRDFDVDSNFFLMTVGVVINGYGISAIQG
jgi:hypothetical protein